MSTPEDSIMNEEETVFRDLLRLLADRKNWTKGVFARDRRGQQVGLSRDDAVCFCIMGASWRVAGYPLEGFLCDALRVSAKELFPDRARDTYDKAELASFNDHESTTIHDVRKVAAHAYRAWRKWKKG